MLTRGQYKLKRSKFVVRARGKHWIGFWCRIAVPGTELDPFGCAEMTSLLEPDGHLPDNLRTIAKLTPMGFGKGMLGIYRSSTAPPP